MGGGVKSAMGITNLNSVAQKNPYTEQKKYCNGIVHSQFPTPLVHVHDFIYTHYIYKANCENFHRILFTMFTLKKYY
jgi:hypothetical protein